jgi:hypothetical protein
MSSPAESRWRHSTALRLELTCDDELLTYCERCWEDEFGG